MTQALFDEGKRQWLLAYLFTSEPYSPLPNPWFTRPPWKTY